ncbi:MAG TPA: lycopene cyclase family protein [Anaerolineaceae bacterium]|nr:lycopene cyclase family protein [Anaerolineaceae bacterium]
MPDYDFIIAGGGVSGLSLAFHLACSPLRGSSILVIDPNERPGRDHALSFWCDHPTPFDPVISHSWGRLALSDEYGLQEFDLGSYRYCSLRRAALTAFIHQELAACPGIEFLPGRGLEIDDDADCAQVRVGGGRTVRGRWVFDSRFLPADLSVDPRRHISLCQHFQGWEIETSEAAFDPRTVTLFDFRVPQKKDLRFQYLLPYSERRALVEYVLLSPDRCEETLRGYVETTLGIHSYRILAREGGVTPLTDAPFPRRAGQRVMNIGIRGGRVKPTAGYAFTRILRDSQAIVASLTKNGHPFAVPAGSAFYQFCDGALLRVMRDHGETVQPIYSALLTKNPIERVFRFLDEEAAPGENLALMLSLPLGYFWQALLQTASARLGLSGRET